MAVTAIILMINYHHCPQQRCHQQRCHQQHCHDHHCYLGDPHHGQGKAGEVVRPQEDQTGWHDHPLPAGQHHQHQHQHHQHEGNIGFEFQNNIHKQVPGDGIMISSAIVLQHLQRDIQYHGHRYWHRLITALWLWPPTRAFFGLSSMHHLTFFNSFIFVQFLSIFISIVVINLAEGYCLVVQYLYFICSFVCSFWWVILRNYLTVGVLFVNFFV